MSPHSTYDSDMSNGVNGSHTSNGVHQVNGVNGVSTDNSNGIHNGITSTRHRRTPQHLKPSAPGAVHDLLCVGFGPASLAVAVALHDSMENGSLKEAPSVQFLERQPEFHWHAGMLIPGAKMQISFIKDLASLRDPCSHFTFLNYLHENGRLIDFINLCTFLPARKEYEDYLSWCAGHFGHVVSYSTEVVSITPVKNSDGPLKTFEVVSKNTITGQITTSLARNVLVAVGGQPSIPKCLPAGSARVIHSSQYAYTVPKLLTDSNAPYRIAVVGAGQSAAEIFNNMHTLYPNSKTSLIMRSEFLKPSDDSPFVNSIFNPDFTDTLYNRSSNYRRNLINEAKTTNYGVVRLELIEHLFEKMYDQRREIGPDEKQWPHRILGGKRILSCNEGSNSLQIKICSAPPGDDDFETTGYEGEEELLEVDLIVAATGYQRRSHLEMLRDAWHLLPESKDEAAPLGDKWHVKVDDGSKDIPTTRVLEVGRDYGVRFAEGAVAPGSGVWLQGCCEGTHGLSDTLLSVLAVRSGEIVDSIFGN
ncbi:L-lysine 6-monooxygenase (NADPH-requiring)-domain-containing protein [Coniochaeta sp. 2T2.1]|nr:L-lysine 6-monooxygenase (NADPH-requiring)-domain-containing protein [Coniochaeta sp. 2T2.1]